MDRFIRWLAPKQSEDERGTSRRDFLGSIGTAGLALAALLLSPSTARASKKKATKKKATKKKASKKKATKKKKTKKGAPNVSQVSCTYNCDHPEEGEVTITLCRGADRACPETLRNVGHCTTCTLDTSTPTTMRQCIDEQRDLSACMS